MHENPLYRSLVLVWSGNVTQCLYRVNLLMNGLNRNILIYNMRGHTRNTLPIVLLKIHMELDIRFIRLWKKTFSRPFYSFGNYWSILIFVQPLLIIYTSLGNSSEIIRLSIFVSFKKISGISYTSGLLFFRQ